MAEFPKLLHTVIDTTDPRSLAEFYRQLMGLHYRAGDDSGDKDWLVLLDSDGRHVLAFQRADSLTPTTWPADDVPMQMHLDLTVTSVEELERQRKRAESLGASLLLDRSDDPEEPVYVFADPSGHPFCILTTASNRPTSRAARFSNSASRADRPRPIHS